MRTPRSAIILITAVIVATVVAVPTGVGLAAYYHDHAKLKVLPSHTLVGNIDVSGLDRAHAVAKVRTTIDQQLDRTATLMVGDTAYTTSLRQLGVRDDVTSAVDNAFSSSRHGSWLSRSWQRVFGGQGRTSVKIALSKPSLARLQHVVDRAAADVNVAPVNASLSLAGSGLSYTSAKSGYALDKAAALTALKASLADGRVRHVDPKVVQPTVGDSAFDT